MMKLSPYSERIGEIFEGDFDYFHFVVDRVQNYQIYLSESLGHCELYLNKGFGNLPTLNSFWIQGEGHDNQIIALNSTLPGSELKINDTFTIGVYGKSDCMYSLLITNQEENLVRVEFQKVFNMDIGANLFYFFDYYNTHKKFEVMVYSDQSDLQIDVIKYEPDSGDSFFEIVRNEKNIDQSHLFHKGSPPWKIIDKSIFDVNIHFILRIRAMEQNTKLDVAIYDNDFPLEIPSSRQTFYALD